MLYLPELERRHLVAIGRDRSEILPVLIGSGRIVSEYELGENAAPHTYLAIVECHDPETAKAQAEKLPHGSGAVFTHSEALSHAFNGLGAQTPAALAR